MQPSQSELRNITLYNKPKRKEHNERFDYGHGQSNYNFVDPCLFQDWTALPFAEEDNIDKMTCTEGRDGQNSPNNHKNSHTQGNKEKLHLHETDIRDSALVDSYPLVME
jgi:hypothetical protein